MLWVGATVMLAAWAVRRSMAPARRLSEQAARIQPDNLAPRLPLQDTDRELQDFVRSFNRTLDRLQSAYQQMEGFNADVAHELRTPLATLINGTQVMLSSPRDAAELRDALESNLEVLEDLKTMVNDMLFLARADRGERAADLSAISLAAEARRVAEYYDAALEERGIRLRCEGDAAVAANPGLVRRALANLISNAIKATPAGHEILLRCRPSPAARVEVRNPGSIAPADLPASSTVSSARAGPCPRTEGHGLACHRPRHRPHARRRRGRPLHRQRNRDRHHAARADRQTSRHAPSRRRAAHAPITQPRHRFTTRPAPAIYLSRLSKRLADAPQPTASLP